MKNLYTILVAGVIVYFLFFKKKKQKQYLHSKPNFDKKKIKNNKRGFVGEIKPLKKTKNTSGSIIPKYVPVKEYLSNPNNTKPVNPPALPVKPKYVPVKEYLSNPNNTKQGFVKIPVKRGLVEKYKKQLEKEKHIGFFDKYKRQLK